MKSFLALGIHNKIPVFTSIKPKSGFFIVTIVNFIARIIQELKFFMFGYQF